MAPLTAQLQAYFGLPPDKLAALMPLFKVERLEKAEFFLRQGQYCQKLSFVKSGYLRIYAIFEDKEVTQWITAKDYFVTDLASFINQVPARWQIQALTPVELYTISYDQYQQLDRLIPEWPQLEKSFLIHCFTILENRVFSFLSMSAQQRYQLFFEQFPTLFNQVPLQYLASMLGMTPETLSRMRNKQRS